MARSGPQPLFDGVTRRLREKIESGELQPGERLPSERWLGESLGVSRTTVHRAVSELVSDGALEARGRAIFVAENRAAAAAASGTLLSFTEMALERGLIPTARVLRAEVRPATWEEADALRIAPGAELFDLHRVRLLDGAAIGTDHDRVPLRLLPRARDIDFTVASFFASLVEAGQAPVVSRVQLEARAATAEECGLLDLSEAAPVLVATEQTIDATGATLSLGCTVFRSDRHRFLATFRRTARPRS